MSRPRLAAALALAVGVCTPLVALAPAATAAVPTASIDPSLTTVNLLSINDFHGRIEFAGSSDKGLALACTYVNTRNELGADSTALISAGDNIGASTFTSASQADTPTVQYLNTLGLAASAVGNHEFDRGFADLTGRVDEEADYPYLGANVYRKGTQTPALPEYEVKTVNGVRVGFVGAVTQQTASMVSPAGIADIDFGDPVAAVNRVSRQLKDGVQANGEADIVVALYHEGAPASAPATLDAQRTGSPGFKHLVDDTAAFVDVIYNAHTHQTYLYDAGSGDARRPVIQSASYGGLLGSVQLGYDQQSKQVTQYVARNIPVPNAPTQPVGTPAGTPDESRCGTDPTYRAVKTLLTDAKGAADKIGDRPVGTVSADVTRAWNATSKDDRAAESTLGDQVAQAWLEALNQEGRPGADIGIMNPGGLRADLLYAEGSGEGDGVVTYKEAFNVNPFANTLQVTTLTGAQFKTVLEQQWQPEGASRPFLKLGLSDNVTYTYDPTRPAGSRVTLIMVDGAPIDPAKDYRVTAGSFLISGGDNFTELGKGRDSTDTGMNDAEEWVSHLERNPSLTPNFAKHAVAVIDPPRIVFGTTTIRVEDLDLTSSGAPKNTTIRGALTDLAAAPPTTVSNEVIASPLPARKGSADVRVILPKRIEAGPRMITFTTRPSGTSFQVPVTVNQLPPGQSLHSPNGRCRLSNQSDGNQVLYGPGGVQWTTRQRTKGAVLSFEASGQLTVRDPAGTLLWGSGSSDQSARLTLQNDCNLVIYGGDNKAVWDAAGNVPRPVPARFGAGQSVRNGAYTFSMQRDGNLVLYRSGRAVWHTRTVGQPGARFAVQGDGNLVVYSKANRPLWNSRTARPGTSDVRLVLTRNGLQAFRNGESRPYWTAG